VSAAVGGSHAIHQHWGRRPVRDIQGVGGRGRDHPQVEQASRAPAGGTAGCVSSAFGYVPADQRLHRPGPQPLLDEARREARTPPGVERRPCTLRGGRHRTPLRRRPPTKLVLDVTWGRHVPIYWGHNFSISLNWREKI
jgi:hypothetical protein